MVTAADFAAYSRATGTPYPQSREQEIELYPLVREFRQNQLKADQNSDFDPVQAVGAGLLGLGVLSGAALLGRRGLQGLKNRTKPQATGSPPTSEGPRGPRPGPQGPKPGRGPNAGSAAANAGSQVIDIDAVRVDRSQAAASNEFTDSIVQNQVNDPSTVNPTSQSFVINNAEKGAEAKAASLQSNPRPTYALGEAAVDVAESAAGFNFDAFIDRTPANQVGNQASELKAQNLANNAVQSLVDQRKNTGPVVEVQIDRALDAVPSEQIQATDRGAGFERISGGGLTARQQRMMQDFAYTGSGQEAGPKQATLQSLLDDDMSGGLSERQLADPVLQRALSQGSSGTSSAFLLTGDVRDLPTADGRTVRELSKKEQKALLGGRPRRNMFADTNLETAERARRSPGGMRPDPAGFVAEMKNEAIDRINAAASLGNTAQEEVLRQQLLDPAVPKDKVQTLLGSTLREVRGRVGTNMQQEITEGARASFGRGNQANNDTEMLARRVQIGDDMYIVDDRNPFVARAAGQSFDPYGAEGLASAEGVGGIVDTETFRERTNTGTTEVPGMVMEATGGPISRGGRVSLSRAVPEQAADTQYVRMERAEDQQLPVRRADGDYDPARGIYVDPVTGATRLDQQAYRQYGKLYSDDLNTQGSRLTGGFEMDAPEASEYITEQPAQRRRQFDANVDERIETIDGVPYVMSSKNIVEGTEPLQGRMATRMKNPDGSTSLQFLEDRPFVDFQLSRRKVQKIVDDALYDYSNNPSMKKSFLEQFRPGELAEGVASGKLLNEIGSGATRNDFIIGRLYDELLQQGVEIPVLKTQKNKFGSYHSTAAHTFLNDLLGTTKETRKYGAKAALDAEGNIIYDYQKQGTDMVLTPRTQGEALEIPSAVKTGGVGGVDPMTIGDDYDDMRNVAFMTPRIGTAPQVVMDARTVQDSKVVDPSTGKERNVRTGRVLSTSDSAAPRESYTGSQLPPRLTNKFAIIPDQTIERTYSPISERVIEQTRSRPSQIRSFGSSVNRRDVGTAGAQMVDYRAAMETAPSERRVAYLSNLGGNMTANAQAIANTKRPYNDLANAAYGARFDPVPDNEPATRNLSYLQGQFDDPVDPISSMGENDINVMMSRSLAQADRRRGSRRN